MNLRLLALRSSFRVRKMGCSTVSAPYSAGVETSKTDPTPEAKVAPSPWQKGKIFQKLRFLTVETINLIIGAEEKKGFSVAQADLFTWAKRLKKERKHENALEIFMWMDKENMVFSPNELAMYVDLIGNAKGFMAAKNLFERVDPNFDNKDPNSANWPAYLMLMDINEEFYRNSNTRRSVLRTYASRY